MAMSALQAASERLPQTGTGTVLNRDQIRRRMSESRSRTSASSESSEFGDEYAMPNKSKQFSGAEAAKSKTTRQGRSRTSASSESSEFGGEYAMPNKSKQCSGAEAAQSKTTRHVTFTEEQTVSQRSTLRPTSSGVKSSPHTSARQQTSHRGPRPTSSGVKSSPHTSARQQTSHRVSELLRIETNDGEGSLEAEVGLYEDQEGKVKGVLELSTLRQRRVPKVKVRVVCLIDTSGSMLLKGDKRNTRSKISIMKNMAVDIIDALEDEEDFFGVMTFGEDSRVICPLTRVSTSTRTQVKQTVSELDKSSGFSAVTDLSSAMMQALDMLIAAQQDEGLLYRNCIIVFSDGEVNAGETDPAQLVHVTRDKIRECTMPRDILADLWVNVSCVTTGSNFSQALYLLSKMCGSDGYFYVDASKDHPEAEMLIPLMLRKTACAQMVSVTMRATNGAALETLKCSQEYSVRKRRGREVERDSMAYFIHDMPTGIKKTFQISVDVEQFTAVDKNFLAIDVQYVDTLGVLHNISKSLHRQEVFSLEACRPRALEVIAKTGISQLRQVLQNTCRSVANVLENSSNDPLAVKESITAAVQTGKNEVKVLTNEILPTLEGSTAESEFQNFSNAVVANLNKLGSIAERNATNGAKCWQFAKAMSSAVARELPTVTNVLAQPQVVCPLPEADGCQSRRTEALSIYVFGTEEETGAKAQLHNAVRQVASSLADVLKSFESLSV